MLGHDGAPCPTPSAPRTVIVYHVNGYHSLRISQCRCSGSPPAYKQYLRGNLFPATYRRPQTAFTFEVLELFHELTLQSKVNAYDFFKTLGRVTDNTGQANHPVST